MTECCGDDRDTRYCPDCGKQLREHDMSTLLAYLKEKQRDAQRRLDGMVRQEALLPEERCIRYRKRPEKMEGERKRATEKVAMWDMWITAVHEVVFG